MPLTSRDQERPGDFHALLHEKRERRKCDTFNKRRSRGCASLCSVGRSDSLGATVSRNSSPCRKGYSCGSRPETGDRRSRDKVNINTADEAALKSLKGIGEKRAKAIIEYREKNGSFKTVDDLAKVKGIGDKQVGKLKDQVTVE